MVGYAWWVTMIFKKYSCMGYYLKKIVSYTQNQIKPIWKHWLAYSFMFILIRYIKTLIETIKFYRNQFEKWGKLDSCCENLTKGVVTVGKKFGQYFFRFRSWLHHGSMR